MEDLASEHRDARHDHQRAHRPGPGGGVVKWGDGWGHEKKEVNCINLAASNERCNNRDNHPIHTSSSPCERDEAVELGREERRDEEGLIADF